MEGALLDLVETALRVAKQALGKRAGKPESGGPAREAHIVAHCVRNDIELRKNPIGTISD
jgi:hypothetical protein